MDPIVTSDVIMEDFQDTDEKQDVHIITPVDSAEEADGEAELRADDHDAVWKQLMTELPDLETQAQGHATWEIDNYRSCKAKEHGPVFNVGDIPWRILIFPNGNNVDNASLYLEHGFEDKPPEGWYSCVQFVLVLWNKSDSSILHHHTATHRFNAEEGDWGFTRFAELRKMFAPSWNDKGRPLVENDAVNVTAFVRIYRDETGVLWHNFNNYDSKKETGMVGLKNQGATCYLNSLLQCLYFTNAFRQAVYQIPTEQDADKSNTAWALQRLFHQLQSNDAAVSTSELTHAFGWETRHIFEQQDVQELSRILMERMEERMKGTEAENALAKMFVGKMKTYISCINVDYESSRIEDFWDVQLNVSGNKDLDASFRDYIQVETMDGENKYYAEGYGLQDAKKGVIFESFPQVLNLQLKRFEYDINRDAMMKVNDRYEFPEFFDAKPYLSKDADQSESWMYELQGVLVHSGDLTAGHYYAFIKTQKHGHFYKFDDDRVTRATLKEALEENFGGDITNLPNGTTGLRNPYTRTLSTKRSMSAYMLVYVRQSRLDSILADVPENAVPEHIARQLAEDKAILERRRKEREEQHLYLRCGVVTDEEFNDYQGFDLTVWDMDQDQKVPHGPDWYRVLKKSTLGDLTAQIAEDKDFPPEHVRLWSMVNRQNNTSRPDQPLIDLSMRVEDAFIKQASRDKIFRLWMERADKVEDGKAIWPETQPSGGGNVPLLIFLKHFDPANQTLLGLKHIFVRKFAKVADILPIAAQTMGWPADTASNIILYEEIKHSMIETLKLKQTLHQAEIQDGDIICFQKELSDAETTAYQQSGKCSTAPQFYDYLLNRVTIQLIPRIPSEKAESLELTLSRKTLYDQFAAMVGEKVDAPPTHIRFYTVQYSTNKPRSVVKRNASQTLNQILNPQYSAYNMNQRNDALIYEVMDMSLSELETKKMLKVTWVGDSILKEDVYELLVAKNGTIEDLLDELKRKAGLDAETLADTRLYYVQNHRIVRELPRDFAVTSIQDYCNLIAQRLPKEDLEPADGDQPINVFSFDKEPGKVHGVPFVFHLKPNETLKDAKVRLSKRTGIKGKQFENIKFAFAGKSAYAKPTYLQDDDVLIDLVNVDEFLALDHLNKTRTPASKGDSIFIR